ncbi:MAG TPA: hypothetical protein VF823_01810, partial [Anaerolineales bacterium]
MNTRTAGGLGNLACVLLLTALLGQLIPLSASLAYAPRIDPPAQNKETRIAIPPDPAVGGAWGNVMNWPLVAVHMGLLHTGQVLMWDGWEFVTTNSARLWDPANPQNFISVANPYSAIFCAGQAQLADGRLLGVGGHNGADIGITATVTFDPLSETWAQQAPLHEARWYPAVIPLADGRML